MGTRLHPNLRVLIEVGLMFLPAIPAYIWMWPNVEGTSWIVAQLAAYAYMLAGCLFIGLRRWNLNQLGLNRNGIGLSLVCGALIIAGRVLITLSVDWPLWQHRYTLAGLVGDVVFYVAAVGLVEELIFRGLLYRALDEWGGARAAIWGSALAFGVYHVGWQGPPGLLAGLIIGAIFAAIRWRAGGIVGLIVVHGLMDVVAVAMLPSVNPQEFGRPDIASPILLLLGSGLLVGTPLYLWKLYPRRKPLARSALRQ